MNWPWSPHQRQPRTRLEIVDLIAVFAWAVGFCYVCGLRGFFALDQSIVFEGAWRLLQGQQPYRDFLLPYGPLVMWLQAAVFSIFGVTYRVYVLTAAVQNGIGAVIVYGLVRKIIPARRWLAVAAGFLTGAWLYAPMGTTYIEQTAFVLLIAVVASVTMGLQSTSRATRLRCMILAGVVLGLAVLTKTNAGVFGVLMVFAVAAGMTANPWRELLENAVALAFGLGLVLAAFGCWLFTKSDPAMFRYCVFQIAGAQGSVRLFGLGFPHLLAGLATGKGNDALRVSTLICATLFGLGLASAFIHSRGDSNSARRTRLLSVLGLGLVCFQHLFSLSSNNNGTNEVPFDGLILCLAVELLFTVGASRAEWNNKKGLSRLWIPGLIVVAFVITGLILPAGKNLDLLAGVGVGLGLAWIAGWFKIKNSTPTGSPMPVPRRIIAASAVLLAVSFGLGVWVSYDRKVQDFFNDHTQYIEHDTIPPLRGLGWAAGVDSGTTHADWADFERVWREVKTGDGQFFIVGDYVVLYGLVGQPSVGPLLWFDHGLSYPADYDQSLDLKLVHAVDQPEITRIILQESFRDTHPLEDFPLLAAAVRDHYHPAEQVGVFRIYRRNP